MRFGYYPGCSLHGAAVDYQMSIDATCRVLNIELEEVDDWNCCGATAAASEDQKMALLLAARNLAKCTEDLRELAVSCNSCYLRLNQLSKKLSKYPEIYRELSETFAQQNFQEKLSKIRVRHILQIIYEEIGLEQLSSLVVNPLKNLNVVPYYGCQLVRPEGFDNKEQPKSLDEVLDALGSKVLPFYRKTKCCGGALISTNEGLALEMMKAILSEASERGAQALVVTCPLCQLNLDAYQSKINKRFNTAYEIPVVYFTQLMGLAFGVEKRRLGLNRGIVPVEKILQDYA